MDTKRLQRNVHGGATQLLSGNHCKCARTRHSGRVTGKLSTCKNDDSCKTGSAYTGRVVNGRIARAAS